MLPVIEKLLVLQDRDRQLLSVEEELAHVGPERASLAAQLLAAQSALEQARHTSKQLESDRKKLELDADSKKQLIDKYSVQQFQTKKNEEYRALAHEIEMCKEVITKLEDQQLEIMEKLEAEQKEVAKAVLIAAEVKKTVDSRTADLNASEGNLRKRLAELKSNRDELASAVEDGTRSKYERLFKNKGRSVVVGIQHGVCGGCHMQLSRSIIVGCQGDQEIVTCPNCGRMLYFTPDMDLAVAD